MLSNIAAHREVLGDDAAFFADRHSAEDIARQLVTAASDRIEATARAARARLAIAPLSVDATAGQYLHIYEQLKR